MRQRMEKGIIWWEWKGAYSRHYEESYTYTYMYDQLQIFNYKIDRVISRAGNFSLPNGGEFHLLKSSTQIFPKSCPIFFFKFFQWSFVRKSQNLTKEIWKNVKIFLHYFRKCFRQTIINSLVVEGKGKSKDLHLLIKLIFLHHSDTEEPYTVCLSYCEQTTITHQLNKQ